MHAILLDWFAAETSTFKRQKFGLFTENAMQNLISLVLV